MSAPYVPSTEDRLTSALLAGYARAGYTEAQTIDALAQRVRELEARLLQAAEMASPRAIVIQPDQACAVLVAENARLREERDFQKRMSRSRLAAMQEALATLRAHPGHFLTEAAARAIAQIDALEAQFLPEPDAPKGTRKVLIVRNYGGVVSLSQAALARLKSLGCDVRRWGDFPDFDPEDGYEPDDLYLATEPERHDARLISVVEEMGVAAVGPMNMDHTIVTVRNLYRVRYSDVCGELVEEPHTIEWKSAVSASPPAAP